MTKGLDGVAAQLLALRGFTKQIDNTENRFRPRQLTAPG